MSRVIAAVMAGWLVLSTLASEPVFVAQVSEGPALPNGIAAHAGGKVRGVPVVAGGSSWRQDKTRKQWHRETWVFVDGKWKQGPILPNPRSDLAYAFDKGGLYVAGGTDGKSAARDVLRLSDVGPKATWQKLAELPEPVESAAGATLNGTFYVAGGKGSDRFWAFDGSRWKARAPLPDGERAYGALVANGDSLYLFGGLQGTNVLRDAHRYDPALNRWEELAGFDLPGFGWSAVSVDESHVMLAGRIDGSNQIRDDIWLVALQSPKPAAIGKLVIQSCCMAPVQVAGNTWWFIGGEPDVGKSRTPRVSVVHLPKSLPAP